ncbi:transglycosylase domain-containing protein [Iodidimonas nitroreducens]|uniref:transglycosylase domain-containing protein n=1 Tax=Iodidimonas nitroreducens TaxID=1236968 RepID=UPI001230691D|nr:transglycosylase domain-containing protein [Iodidimonas nitroreducens]
MARKTRNHPIDTRDRPVPPATGRGRGRKQGRERQSGAARSQGATNPPEKGGPPHSNPPSAASKGARVPRRRPIRRVLYWFAILLVWGGILGVLSFIWIAHDLPDVSNLPPPGQERTVTVKSVTGATLANYGPVRGQWLAYESIPEVMILALLSIEDRRFFNHSGVDILGIGRAVLANLRAGGVSQGGSTLTQQLAKNLFLSSERSLKRKAQELLLALWLERAYSKEQILTLYLNRVYFGAGTYGIDAASETYFGHSARRLSLAQAAMLAGLVKAPSRLAPSHNYAGALQRSEQVLAAMVDTGFITALAADRARNQPPPLAEDAAGPDIRYFTDWVRSRADALLDHPAGGITILTSLISPRKRLPNRCCAPISMSAAKNWGSSRGRWWPLPPMARCWR